MNKQKSFTLMEMLIVIIIVGTLSSVIVVFIGNKVGEAKDSKIKNIMNEIHKSIQSYSMESYPVEAVNCNIRTGCSNLKSKVSIPNIDEDIYYKSSPNGKYYIIYAAKPSDSNRSYELSSDVLKIKEVPSFNNLKAHYPLGRALTGSTVLDMSPNTNNGTNNGANLSYGSDGFNNTGTNFNGTSYIEVPDNNTLDIQTNLTVSLWFKRNVYAYTLISKGSVYTGAGAPVYDIDLASGYINFLVTQLRGVQ